MKKCFFFFVNIDSTFVTKDVIILVIILAVFAILTMITGKIKTKKETQTNIKPQETKTEPVKTVKKETTKTTKKLKKSLK